MSRVGNRIAMLNGVTVAYVMGLANAVLQLVSAFGVNLTATQNASISATLNAFLILVAHASYNQAKTTQTVIPAGPVDQSKPPPAGP